MKERAQVILALHAMLVKAERGDTDAGAVVDTMLAPTAPHANCARSFDRLFHADRPRADEVHHTVVRFLSDRPCIVFGAGGVPAATCGGIQGRCHNAAFANTHRRQRRRHPYREQEAANGA